MTVIPTREAALPQIRPSAVGPYRPSSVAPSSSGLTGRDLMRMLRKRMWMIIIFVLCFTVASVVVTYFWQTYAPQYAADALIAPSQPRATVLADATPANQDVMDRESLQLALLIKRPSVLERALKDPRITGTTWYQQHRLNALRELEEDLVVAPRAKTNLVYISMTGRNPDELPEMVNAIAEAAVKDSEEISNAGRTEERTKLDSEIRARQQDLDKIRSQISALLTNRTVSSLQSENEVLRVKLATLVPKVYETQNELAVARQKLDELRAQASQQGVLENHPYVRERVDYDPTLRNMIMAEKNAAMNLESIMDMYGEKHSAVKKSQETLTRLRKDIKDTTDQIVTNAVQSLLAATQSECDKAEKEYVTSKSEYDAIQKQARDMSSDLLTYEILKDNEKKLDEKVEQWRKRYDELGMAVRMIPPATLRSYATRPKEPSFPKYSILVPLGVALGLIFGIGLALLLEMMDTSVKSPSDVSRRVNLPLLGMLPHTDDMDEDVTDVRMAFVSHPNSLVGEAFRQIRTCLLFSGPAEQRRSLLVSSPMPEDGRTTIAINLAAAFARGGRRAIIIDANFRQPMLHKMFPQTPPGGLSSVLSGQSTWQEQVREIEPNLMVMGSGPLPPNPAELLGSEIMRQLLTELSSQFDQVIFDGPPCLVVSDAAILGTMVSGVVLTVRAGGNTYGIVQRSRDTLLKVGCKILGVVLNGVRVTAGGYLRKNYDTFYEYHVQEASASTAPTQLPDDS